MISNKNFLSQISEKLTEETEIFNCYNKYAVYLPLEAVFTTDSVAIAAYHCASGFRDRNDTFQFMSHVWQNSRKLAERVCNGKFKPQYYKEKTILERGKPRKIKPPVFECKVVQKILCDYLLRAVLESKMISTSYASVRGRSLQDMFEKIVQTLNRCDSDYAIVITDYSSYFASINTDIICVMFKSWGMDERIIELFHSFDPDGIGLSLGNETSQVPASWYASVIDHELKDHYQFKNVFRFMDDTLIICKKSDTEKCLRIIQDKAKEIDLRVKFDKIQIIPCGKEFSFCKERFYVNKADRKYYRIQNPKIVSNEIRKLKAFERKIRDGEMKQEDAYCQANAVIRNIMKHPNNKKRISWLWEITNNCLFANEST